MELLQLRYFYESARKESFTRAAEKYMVPVSSVSAAVRRLEQELGCPLFDRTCNKIVLNQNGKRMQRALAAMFEELDGALDDLASADSDSREIKMLVRAMRNDITDYIIEFNRKQPAAAFKIRFDFGETEPENYDIIIDEKSAIYPDFEGFELFNMRLRLKVAENSPLLGRKLRLGQLADQPFVSLSDSSNMHKILMNSCRRAGFVPNVVAQINDIECYEKLIESGMGIGIERETGQPRNARRIRQLDVADFDERYIVYVYYKRRENYGNVKQFLTFLEKHAYTQL
jgi:LysR family transcriptional activator of glutamate synthase operon